MPQTGKNGFKWVVGPPPAAVQADPIAQTVGDILQRRFNPLPNLYDDDADPDDKTHQFLVSYLRNLIALAVIF